MTDFDKLAKLLAGAASAGYADDAAVGDDIGLYDSDTKSSLKIEKRVVQTVKGEPVSLLYTTAQRGRICQVRKSNLHIHYFFDEESGKQMIADDAARNGVSLWEIVANAPGGVNQ